MASLTFALLTACTFACSRADDPWRGCKLCLETGSQPLLVRQGDPSAVAPKQAPHCAIQAVTSGLPDEPEAVDDLDGLLDRGRVCGPDGGVHAQSVCPSLAAQGFDIGAGPVALPGPPTCGDAAGACPNQKLSLTKTGSEPLELEFYDDPSSHPQPEHMPCLKPADVPKCYYRLGRVRAMVRL
jgi:hypothetical protein